MTELAREMRGVQVLDLGGSGEVEAALDALSQVIDPELGLDAVALGLVYELHLADGVAVVVMTLTTPGCPLHGSIRADVEARLIAVPGVDVVDVRLVWDPAWTPSRISAEGRAQLGWPASDG